MYVHSSSCPWMKNADGTNVALHSPSTVRTNVSPTELDSVTWGFAEVGQATSYFGELLPFTVMRKHGSEGRCLCTRSDHVELLCICNLKSLKSPSPVPSYRRETESDSLASREPRLDWHWHWQWALLGKPISELLASLRIRIPRYLHGN